MCILCTVYCVLCTVYCVLCTVYCVLCTVYCVLCTALLTHRTWSVVYGICCVSDFVRKANVNRFALTQHEQLDFCVQVAKGMHHIASKR